MKWLGVVGTREVDDTIRRDIEQFVGQKIAEGGGIVSGGATGADHEAARLAYECGLEAARFRIFLPVELELYCQALYDRAAVGKCRQDGCDRDGRSFARHCQTSARSTARYY